MTTASKIPDQTRPQSIPLSGKPKLPPAFVVQTTISITNWLDKLRIKMMPPSVTVLNQITGLWTTQLLYVAANLNIADHLDKKPLTIRELAEVTEADEQTLYRMMRALASQGLFKETRDGRFKLTGLGKCLRTGTPGSMRDMALMNGRPFHWQVWENFLEVVKTGQPGFERTHGRDSFSYFNQHPEDDAIFSGAMTGMAMQSLLPIVAAYDFSRFSKIADIGGGYGSLLVAALRANPELKGILFDRPSVTARAAQEFEAALKGRVEFVSGDFFEEVPEGGDLYVLKTILHDFSDEKALAILKQCRQAMNSEARLAIMEMIIPAGNHPFPGKMIDLEMLMMTPGGRERSEAEYGKLLEAAGFKLTRVIPTISPISILEAAPV
jgi:hypothetical protein